MSSHKPHSALKSVMLQGFIWAISLSYGVLDWSIYREAFFRDPNAWTLHLRGGLEAPEQYRIGIWMVVDWMDRFFQWLPYETLALLDVICLGLALWFLLIVLRNSRFYITASTRTRWLAVAGALCLAEYYLAWGHWYQTGMTMPSVLFVVLSLGLISGKLIRNRPFACVLLVVLGWLQGFVRADVAVLLHVGILLAMLFNRRISVPLGRAWQAGASLVTAIVAVCIRLYVAHIWFPHAGYGAGGIVHIGANANPEKWLIAVLALLPYWVLLGLVLARRYRPSGPAILVMSASVLYLAAWVVLGRLDEARTFVPFAFALIPSTVIAYIGLIPKSVIEPEAAAAAYRSEAEIAEERSAEAVS